MKDFFYELEVSSQNALELFSDFVFEFGVIGVEFKDKSFIVRDEDSLGNLEFALLNYQKELKKALNLDIDLKLNFTKQKNIDWITKYKEGVNPIEISEFYIHPSWCEPKQGLKNIIIDPALAFGSGHHESTNMCLNLISKYKNGYKIALDVGCGSGILSIALAKSGLKVSSCDTDEQAVEATKQNASKNKISLDEIWTGSISNLDKTYDLVVANIIADVILILKKDLINALDLGGILILSGILNSHKDRIKNEFKELRCLEILEKNEWMSFVFKKER